MHVKKDDKVMVITGKDKGKKGVIRSALPQKDRVLVEGVNMVKKHSHLKRIHKVVSLSKKHQFMCQTLCHLIRRLVNQLVLVKSS